MKKLVLATASASILASAFVTHAASAEESVADNTVVFNAAVTSDYRFRGISQSRLDPAISGGIDYTHNQTGLYVGAWASSIKWIEDAGGNGNVEVDLYGGKRGQVTDTISYDVGVLTYVYPGNDLSTNANTTEVYGQLGYGPAYIKYSRSVTNLFGFADSKNSGYWDLGTNVAITNGYTLNLHAGHQTVKNNSSASYSDWKVGVTKDFGFLTANIAAVGTNNDIAYLSPSNQNLGKIGALVSISKTF